MKNATSRCRKVIIFSSMQIRPTDVRADSQAMIGSTPQTQCRRRVASELRSVQSRNEAPQCPCVCCRAGGSYRWTDGSFAGMYKLAAARAQCCSSVVRVSVRLRSKQSATSDRPPTLRALQSHKGLRGRVCVVQRLQSTKPRLLPRRAGTTVRDLS